MVDILELLYRLLDNDVPCSWTKLLGKAFQKVKKLLCEAPVLELHDVNKDILLCCEASDYGVVCAFFQMRKTVILFFPAYFLNTGKIIIHYFMEKIYFLYEVIRL